MGMSEREIIYASATKLAQMIRSKQISPLELMRIQIARIKAVDPQLHAVEYLAEEQALKQAAEMTEAIKPGGVDWDRMLLWGVGISVKDNIEVAGMPTKCGAPALKDYISTEDATAVRRLRNAGAIVVAKTRLPFMTAGYDSENLFGRANNPYDLDKVVGGSSGGEGGIVSAAGTPLGVAQDCNGSIRVPAHVCGVSGLAPALGRVSIAGLYPPTENLHPHFCHRIGPIARHAEDLPLALSIMAGLDYRDPFTHPFPIQDSRKVALRGLRVSYWTHQKGLQRLNPTAETIAAVENAAEALRRHGANVVETKPPVELESFIDVTLAMWFGGGVGDFQKLLREYDAEKDSVMQDQVVRISEWLGKHPPEQIQSLRAQWPQLRQQVFASTEEYDAILTPVTAGPALPHGLTFQAALEQLHFVYPAVYSPQYSLPFGVVRCGGSPEGLPIGVQVVGSPYREDVVMAVLKGLEQEEFGGWKPPPL
jgi:amidase